MGIFDIPTITVYDQNSATSGEELSGYTRLRMSRKSIGGAWELSFTLSSNTRGAGYLDDWFEGKMGFNIKARKNGRVIWSGKIWEMSRHRNGLTRTRSLHTTYNAVRAAYGTTPSYSSFVTDPVSITKYGRRETTLTDSYSSLSAEATAAATTYLANNGRPYATVRGVAQDESLEVICQGDSWLLDNVEATQPAGATSADLWLSSIITSAAVGINIADFQTNALTITPDANAPITTAWKEILRIVAMGDGTKPWNFRVEDNNAYYAPVDFTPIYHWTQHGLRAVGGATVDGWSAETGIVRDMTMPPSPAAPNSPFLDGRDFAITQITMAQDEEAPTFQTSDYDPDAIISEATKYQRWLEKETM